jgi:hypothetical protein
MTLSQTGIYHDTITNDVIGSYVIHQVSVTVYPTYLFEDTVTVCSSSLPFIWHDLVVNEAGTREIFLQTAETYCDSIYRLTLYVSPSYQVTESVTLCENELPYEWRGQLLTESGNYQQTLTTVNGCDSIIVLRLNVYPLYSHTYNHHISSVDTPYVWEHIDATGKIFPSDTLYAEGKYDYTFTNGCLDVSRVLNNKRRKYLTALEMKDVIRCGPATGPAFQKTLKEPGVKVHNWFVNRDAKLYFFYFPRKGVKHVIVVELVDEMVAMIRSKNYLPRDAWYDEEGRQSYGVRVS